MSDRLATPAARPQALPSGRRRTIVLFVAAVSLYWAALYLYVPTLPTYVESKSDNLAMVGVVLSMYGLWQAIIRLPLGIVSDWLGKRKLFIIIGFALAGLGALVMSISDNVTGLLIGRAITGLAAGTWVPLVVMFSSLFPPEESVKASALLTLTGSVSRMFVTGISGSLNELGGYALAFQCAAGAAVLAMLIIVPNREKRRESKRPALSNIKNLVTRRDVLLPSLLSAVNQYGQWAATFAFIPILATRLGATGTTQSALLSMNMGVFTIGNLLATTVAKRVGARRLAYASTGLLFAGLGAVALAPSLPFIFVCQFVIGLAQGTAYPVLMGMSIRHVGENQRASAMGLHQAVYAIGMFSGPAASGLVADAIGIRPMFATTGAIGLALAILVARGTKARDPDTL